MRTPEWVRVMGGRRVVLLACTAVALVVNGIGALTRSEWGRGAALLALAPILVMPTLVTRWYLARSTGGGKPSHPHLGTLESAKDGLMNATDTQWYWCLDHNAAEPADSPCPPDRRWGPYESREAAEHWRERVDARNEEWDAADKEWEEG